MQTLGCQRTGEPNGEPHVGHLDCLLGLIAHSKKGCKTLLNPTHLSFGKDNSFVVSQSLWMFEVTRGMSRYVSELRNVSGRWAGVANVENVARRSRSRLLESSDTVHNKHGGKVS